MIASYLDQVRSLFLPDSFNGYYVTTKKLVGLEIQHNLVLATVVQAQGYKKTITGCFQQEIVQDELIPLEERVVDALKKVAVSIGNYDELIVSLSNNVAIFKEITIPFTDIDTIKMVIPFAPFASFADQLMERGFG